MKALRFACFMLWHWCWSLWGSFSFYSQLNSSFEIFPPQWRRLDTVPQLGTSVTEDDIAAILLMDASNTVSRACAGWVCGQIDFWVAAIVSFASEFPRLWLHSPCDRPNELVKIRIDKAPITANSLYRHWARLCCGLCKCNLVKDECCGGIKAVGPLWSCTEWFSVSLLTDKREKGKEARGSVHPAWILIVRSVVRTDIQQLVGRGSVSFLQRLSLMTGAYWFCTKANICGGEIQALAEGRGSAATAHRR